MTELHPLLRRVPTAAAVSAIQPTADALARSLRSALRPLGVLASVEASPYEGGGSLATTLERHRGSVAALFSLEAPAGAFVILMDTALVFAATEAVLGGDGREPPHNPARVPTRIELRIARIVAEHAARALQSCLDASHADDMRKDERVVVNVGCEKIETNLDFVDLGSQSGKVTLLALNIELLGRQGWLSLILPEELISILARPASAAKVAVAEVADPIWTKRFECGPRPDGYPHGGAPRASRAHARRHRRAEGRPDVRSRRERRCSGG